MIFLEKKGSPDFAKKLVEKIPQAKDVSFYGGIGDGEVFDGINLNNGELFYSEKKGEDFYLVTDQVNVYVLTFEQMKAIQAALNEAHLKFKEAKKK